MGGCPSLGVVVAGDSCPLYVLTHGTLADSGVCAVSDTVTLSMGRSCGPFPRASTLSTALSLDASAILYSAGGSFVLCPAGNHVLDPVQGHNDSRVAHLPVRRVWGVRESS